MIKLTIPQQHQRAIAKMTLRMTPTAATIMGGMTIEEAKTFLKSIGYTDKQIERLSK
jgi:hypothetical protein